MQSHLSLVSIPSFLLLHFKEALEHSVVAVSADCSVKFAEEDKLLDAITRISANNVILTSCTC